MPQVTEDRKFRERMQRVEGLLKEVEAGKDAGARERTREIVRRLMELHEAGLDKILSKIAATGDTGLALINSLAQDDLISSLLLLYGLHPLNLESRVRLALEKVRPYLRSHNGNVELLEIRDGVVNLRMEGSCHGCPSSAVTMKQTIEEAIYELAPDAAGIVVEGVEEPAPPAPANFVPIEQLGTNGHRRHASAGQV